MSFLVSLFGVPALIASLSITAAAQYTQLNIVSNVSGKASSTDPNLIFGTDATLIQGLNASGPGGSLEAPWGIVLAPSNFGPASNKLLVGNVDNGRINILDPSSGGFLGPLTDVNGKRIMIGGLWALAFGAGNVANRCTNQLFLQPGPANYVHGLFGVILPARHQ